MTFMERIKTRRFIRPTLGNINESLSGSSKISTGGVCSGFLGRAAQLQWDNEAIFKGGVKISALEKFTHSTVDLLGELALPSPSK